MKYILYGTKNAYRLTTVKNYNAYIQDVRKINYFDGFKTISEVLNYISLYCPIALNDISIIANN
jgi:hypothetical protein